MHKWLAVNERISDLDRKWPAAQTRRPHGKNPDRCHCRSSCFCAARLRRKGGKEHRTGSIVQNRRAPTAWQNGSRAGEINSARHAAWRMRLDIIEEGIPRLR